MQSYRLISRLFIDSQLFISLAAVCMCYCTDQILSLPPTLPFYFFIFSNTLVAYLFPFFFRNGTFAPPTLPLLISILSGCVCFYYLTTHLTVAFFICYGVLSLLTLAYYLPLIGRTSRLRQIPYLKPFIIAFNWSLATVVLPVIAGKAQLFSFPTVMLFFERFLFMAAITIPFDIRDMEADQRHHLQTIPLAVGIRKTLLIAVGLLFLYQFVTILHYGWGDLFWARVVCVLVVLGLFLPINGTQSRHYYTGLLDGSMILQCLLVSIFH